MAFLLSFIALCLSVVAWLGLYVWLSNASSPLLNAAALWLSPEGLVGWIFFVALAVAFFWMFVRWRGGLR
jgi:hypothetical protein